jgi:hypothetical protein
MSAVEIQPRLPLTKDPTAAERQRRRREKQRHRDSPPVTVSRTVTASVTPSVTERDSESVTEEPVTPVTVTEEPVTEHHGDHVTDDGAMILCARQTEVTAGFNAAGDLILTQINWPDDDSIIIVRAENIADFIDKLTDVLGIPSSLGGPR